MIAIDLLGKMWNKSMTDWSYPFVIPLEGFGKVTDQEEAWILAGQGKAAGDVRNSLKDLLPGRTRWLGETCGITVVWKFLPSACMSLHPLTIAVQSLPGLNFALNKKGARGSVVVKALCYKPEVSGLDSRWGEFLNFPNPSGRTRPWDLLCL
jgi:hypothetical protein